MKIRNRLHVKALLLGLFVLLTGEVGFGQAPTSPFLIPFQGRLTNPQGVPYTNGQYTIIFNLYDQPVGGTLLWSETHQKVGVINGMLNVFLGSINPALSNAPFSQTLHLGITIDADGNPNTPDPEMVPRQMIIPAFWAKQAENSAKLAGYDWSSILAGGNNNPITGTIGEQKLPFGIAVPVGGIIMWWGSIGRIPAGFELCDGNVPSTSGATLTGPKPNLIDVFPKGATSGASDVKSTPVTGGSNTIPQRQTGGTAITVDQMPSHIHGINDPGHSHTEDGYTGFHASGNGGGQPYATSPKQTSTDKTGITIASTGGDQPHDHTIPAHDNRPAFLEVFFIIRVK